MNEGGCDKVDIKAANFKCRDGLTKQFLTNLNSYNSDSCLYYNKEKKTQENENKNKNGWSNPTIFYNPFSKTSFFMLPSQVHGHLWNFCPNVCVVYLVCSSWHWNHVHAYNYWLPG